MKDIEEFKAFLTKFKISFDEVKNKNNISLHCCDPITDNNIEFKFLKVDGSYLSFEGFPNNL